MDDKELLDFVEQELFYAMLNGVSTLDHLGYTEFESGSWQVALRADQIARLLDLAEERTHD